MNKFKDSVGRFFTKGLFKETAIGEKKFVLYTLEEAKQLYLSCDDITGYEFASNHLGGWKHWIALHNSPTLEPILREWEEELEVKLRSQAIKNIMTLSVTDKGYQASKFLADRGWKVKETGRPTKEAIQKETRVQSRMYEEFSNVVDLKK
jgi:hypothetical protein